MIKNEKVRFGVVGTNKIVDTIIEAAKRDKRFDLQAVYSRKEETALAFAKKHKIPHSFTSLEKMLDADYIDAVYIASPNALHAQQAILSMKAGKHVLCEKPLASNAKEAKEMIAVANKMGVTLMEAMKPTLTPNFLQLMAHLDKVGKVRHYAANFCQYSSRYNRFKAGIHVNAFDPSLSNGAAMDIGIYTIYPMVVLFGKPSAISAQGVLLSSGVDGSGTVSFLYPNGMTAQVSYSKISDSYQTSEIQGEKGSLIIDRIQTIKQLKFLSGKYSLGDEPIEIETLDLSVEATQGEYYYEIKEFIDLIETNQIESSINSHQNSLHTLEIIDEIRRQLAVVYPADR